MRANLLKRMYVGAWSWNGNVSPPVVFARFCDEWEVCSAYMPQDVDICGRWMDCGECPHKENCTIVHAIPVHDSRDNRDGAFSYMFQEGRHAFRWGFSPE